MRKIAFLMLALGLLVGAMAPVLETIDTWDDNPALSSDTEFQLVAFAFGIGIGIAAVLVANHLLRSLRTQRLLKPIISPLGVSPGPTEPCRFALGLRIRPPLRI